MRGSQVAFLEGKRCKFGEMADGPDVSRSLEGGKEARESGRLIGPWKTLDCDSWGLRPVLAYRQRESKKGKKRLKEELVGGGVGIARKRVRGRTKSSDRSSRFAVRYKARKVGGIRTKHGDWLEVNGPKWTVEGGLPKGKRSTGFWGGATIRRREGDDTGLPPIRNVRKGADPSMANIACNLWGEKKAEVG